MEHLQLGYNRLLAYENDDVQKSRSQSSINYTAPLRPPGKIKDSDLVSLISHVIVMSYMFKETF